MCLDELNRNGHVIIRSILGTDISKRALAQARDGLYSSFEMARGLDQDNQQPYFQQEGAQWRILPRLRLNIQFKELNLMSIPVDLGMFDIIFCRNVMIYFAQDTRQMVV